MATHSIFYSWQSDRPNSVNRGFIEDCLERVIKDVHADEELTLAPCPERDTSGVPGAPDIAATIFDKIKRSDVFVADVTFIDEAGIRRTPNPNVLVELGFAAGHLGWGKVICIFNAAFGRVEDLPFDLRPRRVRSYKLVEGGDKTEARKSLVSALKADIIEILHAPDKATQEAFYALISKLAAELISVIIFGSEFEYRNLNPKLDSLKWQFSHSAGVLRDLATTDPAIEHGIESELITLANKLDEAANYRLYAGAWEGFASLVKEIVEKATALKASWIDILPADDEQLKAAKEHIAAAARKMKQLSQRADALANAGRWDEVQEEASEWGEKLLRLAHYQIDACRPGLAKELYEIARSLHLIDTMRVSMDGGRSIKAIVDKVQNAADRLALIDASIRGNPQ